MAIIQIVRYAAPVDAPTVPTWLVRPRDRFMTPHRYRAGGRVLPVELAVVHWTASPLGHDAEGANRDRIARWLLGHGRDSSTHFVVLRDGTILQSAPLEDRTWHAGGSAWVALDGAAYGNVNNRSIGVDLENVGPLSHTRGCWRDDYGGRYEGPPPYEDRGEHYEPYREIQIVALLGLVSQIVAVLPILAHPGRWVGHEEIRRTKIDPGPAFPWARLRAALLS